MEYNYHNFARVPCRKRLRVQSNNRRVRASTPLVSRGTRWDPRIFECFRPRVNARVPPHRFRPLLHQFSHHAIFGCSVHVTARKLKRRKWFGSRTCIVAWRALVRQPPNNRPFFYTFNRPYIDNSPSLHLKGFSLKHFSALLLTLSLMMRHLPIRSLLYHSPFFTIFNSLIKIYPSKTITLQYCKFSLIFISS